MAKGSEQFTWKLWPFGKECSSCGRKLRIQDVGEQRTTYNEDGSVRAHFLWCKDHRGGRA